MLSFINPLLLAGADAQSEHRHKHCQSVSEPGKQSDREQREHLERQLKPPPGSFGDVCVPGGNSCCPTCPPHSPPAFISPDTEHLDRFGGNSCRGVLLYKSHPSSERSAQDSV
ncbi:Hypothetical predicted protein [Xyrichtys novacula]|uniref:Uncharacterized protein n=1 Tax=Xyrichtys novacula TaxID=13765 RepID=A0AAV1H0Q3_XYRNO|nr:Hypothetical predicted protein [Xyrichtys novacula]